MKSLTAVCQTSSPMPNINPSGRISRPTHQRGDGENAEMKMYLSKLKDLVPFMPKNRKLSKLEIIQHVIDYICDLQSELETHTDIVNFDSSNALNFNGINHSQNNGIYDEEMFSERLSSELESALYRQQQQSSPAQRQPLVDRQTPNTILPSTQSTTHITQHHQISLPQQQAAIARTSQSLSTSEKDIRQPC